MQAIKAVQKGMHSKITTQVNEHVVDGKVFCVQYVVFVPNCIKLWLKGPASTVIDMT